MPAEFRQDNKTVHLNCFATLADLEAALDRGSHVSTLTDRGEVILINRGEEQTTIVQISNTGSTYTIRCFRFLTEDFDCLIISPPHLSAQEILLDSINIIDLVREDCIAYAGLEREVFTISYPSAKWEDIRKKYLPGWDPDWDFRLG